MRVSTRDFIVDVLRNFLNPETLKTYTLNPIFCVCLKLIGLSADLSVRTFQGLGFKDTIKTCIVMVMVPLLYHEVYNMHPTLT